MTTLAELRKSLAGQLPPLSEIRAEIQRREAEQKRIALARDVEAIRRRCETLAGFCREAWAIIEPNAKLIWNWHLDALCEHLEAITYGQINRLLINVPPGSSKSLIVSVLWQAWEWGPGGRRSHRFLTTAYNDVPVKRDSRKCRDLIKSAWYQVLWPEVVLIRAGEMSFANSQTGTREGVAFGSLTSQRGDRLIIDDPHSTKTAESVAVRETTTRNFREGAINRLNDQEKSAIVVVMQRLHEEDVSGVIIKLKMGYVHLCLPMEFEPERRCRTSIGFVDPRSADGELLDPVRFPRATVNDLKRDMGSTPFAGQYQQRPVAREGGMFKRAWFDGKLIDAAAVPSGTVWVRFWDLAGTKKKALNGSQAATAGVKLGRMPNGGFVVGHVVRVFEEGPEVRRTIKATAVEDGKAVQIGLPQDPGQAGKGQAKDFILMLAGWKVYAEIETGDKETRAEPFSAQCEAGNVLIVNDTWTTPYLDELCLFPGSAVKDQVDASANAFARLNDKRRVRVTQEQLDRSRSAK